MEAQSIKQRFGIIGNSAELNYAISIAMRVGPTNLTVLISGESGVGKEIFSQIIHHLSSRKHNPFIAVNCGAIPEGTIDSELFGHEKGAFTGAYESRKGYFEAVNGGTIFLDEIGELPMGTQARLLRVLESGEYIRVGSSKVQKTDVRVIAATNVDLFERVKKGKFREDLYYRLNTVPIRIPALRERKEDIYLLFRKFSIDFSEKYRSMSIQLDEEARHVLENYSWPGNVRELKNLAEQISVLTQDKDVDAETLKQFIPDHSQNNLPALLADVHDGSSDISERDLFYRVLIDMKKDINDLKAFVRDMAGAENYQMERRPEVIKDTLEDSQRDLLQVRQPVSDSKPVVINDPREYEEESVEESLSIADKEKELIIKALAKHKGKRKDAALDLGISERTLYRKIKEYEITE